MRFCTCQCYCPAAKFLHLVIMPQTDVGIGQHIERLRFAIRITLYLCQLARLLSTPDCSRDFTSTFKCAAFSKQQDDLIRRVHICT